MCDKQHSVAFILRRLCAQVVTQKAAAREKKAKEEKWAEAAAATKAKRAAKKSVRTESMRVSV